MAKPPDEDRHIDPKLFPELNHSFYTSHSGPHDYINGRLRALFLAVSPSEHVAQAEASGLQIGEVGTLPKEATRIDDGGESRLRARQDYLLVESTVLLHHAAEALVRLFLAHRGEPPCPRLEAARLYRPAAFYKEADRFRDALPSNEARADLLSVFTGQGANMPEGSKGWSEDVQTSQIDGLTSLMGTAIDVLDRDGNLYNAAKHGITVAPSELLLALVDEPGSDTVGGLDISAEGPILTFLEVDREKRRWAETSTWIFPEANIHLTYLIARQIRALMHVGRVRYVEGGPLAMIPISKEDVEEAARRGKPDKLIQIPSVSQGLLYLPEADQKAPPRGKSKSKGQRHR